MKKRFQTILIVLISALIYAIAMKAFVESGQLFPGGFSGLSRLISLCLERFLGVKISFGMIYFTLNILCTVFVFRYIGHWFTIYSAVWFTAASILTDVLPAFPITEDKLLISIFGGILGGFAIGLSLRHDASSGGMDFLAIYASSRFNIPTWNYVLLFNVGVLTCAGLLFGWNQALYSIIYQFCSTQVVNALHDRFKLNTLIIVTEKPDEVSQSIFSVCRHGITCIPSKGEFLQKPNNVLLMTINAYQQQDVIRAVRGTDPNAFISVSKTDKIIGNYYQKPLE